MVTNPYSDAATLAMLKMINPDHDRIWRAWDDLGRKGNRNGTGAVRVLDAPDGAGTMSATPGPWVAKARPIGGYNIVAVDDVLEDVVVGTAVLNDHSLETAHANACVLAAGPQMLPFVRMLAAIANEFQWVADKGMDPEGVMLWSQHDSANPGSSLRITVGDLFRARAVIDACDLREIES